MKTYREELWFDLPQRRAIVNITDQVRAAVRKSGVKDGLCLVNAMHMARWTAPGSGRCILTARTARPAVSASS